jgi:hypothetical protein
MISLREMQQRLLRFEPFIFLLLLAIHVSVLFRFEWYPTLDGPAHLYNAHLIAQLLQGNEFLARYLEFSSFPEPNWSGHAIMALLSTFLPANWVEKGLVLIIFTGTAFAFRGLVLSFSERRTWTSLLIFPFLASFTLRIGFFNFSLSIALFLAILVFWNRRMNSFTLGHGILLSALTGLLYFSHALTTVVCMGSLVLWTAASLLHEQAGRNRWWRQLGGSILAMLPWLILILLFIGQADDGGIVVHLPASELMHMAWGGVPFTLHWGPSMQWSARVLALVIIILSALTIWLAIRQHGLLHVPLVWPLLAVFSLGAFLFMPDKAATGGLISLRYLLFFHLFLVIWLATRPAWPAGTQWMIAPYLLASLWLVRIDHAFTGELSADVQEIRQVLPYIRDDSAVLPLVYSDYWFHGNFSNYLGTERGILVLDNYEALSQHFPLRWKEANRPPMAERMFYNSPRPCIDIDELGRSMRMSLDHVIRWPYSDTIADSCTLDLTHQLYSQFQTSHRPPDARVELYQR